MDEKKKVCAPLTLSHFVDVRLWKVKRSNTEVPFSPDEPVINTALCLLKILKV